MKTSLCLALAAGLAIAEIGSAVSPAAALPMSGLDPAVATSTDIAQNVDKVWWHRHYWGGYGYRPWGYWHRPYWGGYYGWHRPWGWYRPWGWRHW